jgi:hypothetical protein
MDSFFSISLSRSCRRASLSEFPFLASVQRRQRTFVRGFFRLWFICLSSVTKMHYRSRPRRYSPTSNI